MEPSSIVLIIAPILFPIAARLGINPVHLGIMMTVNMEVGMCHPPVGLNLYVASGIARMGITELTVAVWPWLMAMLVFLVHRHLHAGDFAVAAARARDVVSYRAVIARRRSRRSNPGAKTSILARLPWIASLRSQ